MISRRQSRQPSLVLYMKQITWDLKSHLDAVFIVCLGNEVWYAVNTWFPFCYWPLTQYGRACVLSHWEIDGVKQKKDIRVCASSIIIVTISFIIIVFSPLFKVADPGGRGVTLEQQSQPVPLALGLAHNEASPQQTHCLMNFTQMLRGATASQ